VFQRLALSLESLALLYSVTWVTTTYLLDICTALSPGGLNAETLRRAYGTFRACPVDALAEGLEFRQMSARPNLCTALRNSPLQPFLAFDELRFLSPAS